MAFSWPEPQFSGTMTPYLIESSKFAWLEGDVSLPSNASGVAKFTNLTVNFNFNIVFMWNNRSKDLIPNMFTSILFVMV